MASLVLLLAAFLACVAGEKDDIHQGEGFPMDVAEKLSHLATPPDFPLKFTSKTMTLDEKRRVAEEACKHIEMSNCQISCQYKSIGVIDKDGQYDENGAGELLAVYGGFEQQNPQAREEAAKICKRVNFKETELCMRAGHVLFCLHDEYQRVIDEMRKNAHVSS